MTRPFAALPETNLKVMEHLHTYRFLTAPQLLRLDVASHINSLRRALRRFETSRKYVDFAEFGVVPKIGRLPRVYYLTERGAKYLAEAWRVDAKEINYPKGVKLFARDYFHRSATIDFHIELRLFAEQNELAVEFFHSYFDTTGANRSENPADRLQRLSKVPLEEGFFIPDGIFAVHAPDGSRYLYALEVYNGIDTKRVHAQMEKHLIALGEGHISELYNYPKAHRVLCLFEHENALKAAEKRLREDTAFTEKMRRQFALSTLAGIRENFGGNWLFLERGRTTIFDTLRQAVKPQAKVRQFFDRLGV
jgi:hypothetical protein